nr:MAG TPA: hypothetical protein [Bacteriophage sp.]
MYHFADCVIIGLPFFFDWWRFVLGRGDRLFICKIIISL